MPRDRWIGPALGAVVACALFALRSLELTGDSLNELRAIASEDHPFLPHHLLFAPIVRAFLGMLRWVQPACDALFAAQLHNALWAGLGIAAAYAILAHELRSRRGAALWALGLGASAGITTFATQVEAYVPALGCLLLLGAVLLRAPSGPGRTLGALALFALAVLYHQSAVLFAVPLVVLVWRDARARAQAGASWAMPCAFVLAASGALVFAIYGAASGERSLAGVLRFSASYLHHPEPEWASWSNVSLVGAGRLLRSQLQNLVYLPDAQAPVVSAMVGALALLLAGLATLALVEARRDRRALAALLFPGTWLAAHWGFFLWFLPRESDHFVLTVFPLLLLVALVLQGALQSPAARRAGLVAGVALLSSAAAWNTLGLALPRHRDRGRTYQEAAELARLGLVERSLVLCEYELRVHLATFFGPSATAVPMLVLQRFYQDEAPELLPRMERVVVPVRNVMPDYAVGPYSGRTHPRGWLAFVRWISAFDPGVDGAPATYASLELARTASGECYLVLDRSRHVVGDLDELLVALEQKLVSANPLFELPGSTRDQER